MEKRLYKRHFKKETNILTTHSGGDKILFGIVFVVFLIHSLTLIYPVIWMFLNSLKEQTEYWVSNSIYLPKKWLFSNYIRALSSLNDGTTNFVMMIVNSVWHVGMGTLAGILTPMACGYVLSRYKFRGSNLIYSVVIFSLTIPIIGSGASALRIYANLNLYDNPMRRIVDLFGGLGGSFLVFYGFFKSVSWSYAEAVEIDGGGPFTIFFRIMVPQAVPIILTYFITGAIANWNQYEGILLFYPSWPTLSAGLFKFRSNNARADYPLYYAGLIISMIPSLILFILSSSKIMTSLSMGGLKG